MNKLTQKEIISLGRTLEKMGICIKTSNGVYRSLDDILNEFANKWDKIIYEIDIEN
jgi:hypothetical protein